MERFERGSHFLVVGPTTEYIYGKDRSTTRRAIEVASKNGAFMLIRADAKGYRVAISQTRDYSLAECVRLQFGQDNLLYVEATSGGRYIVVAIIGGTWRVDGLYDAGALRDVISDLTDEPMHFRLSGEVPLARETGDGNGIGINVPKALIASWEVVDAGYHDLVPLSPSARFAPWRSERDRALGRNRSVQVIVLAAAIGSIAYVMWPAAPDRPVQPASNYDPHLQAYNAWRGTIGLDHALESVARALLRSRQAAGWRVSMVKVTGQSVDLTLDAGDAHAGYVNAADVFRTAVIPVTTDGVYRVNFRADAERGSENEFIESLPAIETIWAEIDRVNRGPYGLRLNIRKVEDGASSRRVVVGIDGQVAGELAMANAAAWLKRPHGFGSVGSFDFHVKDGTIFGEVSFFVRPNGREPAP